jgi:hypothetical protein
MPSVLHWGLGSGTTDKHITRQSPTVLRSTLKARKMRILFIFLTIFGPVICDPLVYAVDIPSKIPAYGNVARDQNMRLRPRTGCDVRSGECPAGKYPFRPD